MPLGSSASVVQWLDCWPAKRKVLGSILFCNLFLLLARYVPNVAKEEYMRSV